MVNLVSGIQIIAHSDRQLEGLLQSIKAHAVRLNLAKDRDLVLISQILCHLHIISISNSHLFFPYRIIALLLVWLLYNMVTFPYAYYIEHLYIFNFVSIYISSLSSVISMKLGVILSSWQYEYFVCLI